MRPVDGLSSRVCQAKHRAVIATDWTLRGCFLDVEKVSASFEYLLLRGGQIFGFPSPWKPPIGESFSRRCRNDSQPPFTSDHPIGGLVPRILGVSNSIRELGALGS